MYPKGLPQWTKAFGRMKTLAKNDVRTFNMKLRHDSKILLVGGRLRVHLSWHKLNLERDLERDRVA
jgi:hypothetical protein